MALGIAGTAATAFGHAGPGAMGIAGAAGGASSAAGTTGKAGAAGAATGPTMANDDAPSDPGISRSGVGPCGGTRNVGLIVGVPDAADAPEAGPAAADAPEAGPAEGTLHRVQCLSPQCQSRSSTATRQPERNGE